MDGPDFGAGLEQVRSGDLGVVEREYVMESVAHADAVTAWNLPMCGARPAKLSYQQGSPIHTVGARPLVQRRVARRAMDIGAHDA